MDPATAADVDAGADDVAPRHHMFIGGTGRAGTSFLVQYLTGLGLDTHLSRQAGSAGWNEEANAGLEDLPFTGTKLPYVVKSPWLHEHLDEILARPTEVHIDAVLVPVRPLEEAAASRVVLELRAMHERSPWMAELDRSWSHAGGVAGGGVFSLHPLDQARVLAVGFHHLVERLVHADVPLVLLDFPRLVLDADYLFTKLAPVLPAGTDRDRAHEVYRTVANPASVRIGAELAGAADAQREGGALDTLDRLAIRRELVRLRRLLDARTQEATSAAASRDALTAELGRLRAGATRSALMRAVRRRWFPTVR